MTAIVAFTQTSPVTQGAAPFLIGQAFARGDVPAGQYVHLDITNFSVVPLRYWNDGSLKHAALMGRVPVTATTPKQVNVVLRGSAPSVGTPLTSADIVAAAPSASLAFGALGTAALASLGSPSRTWYSTKELVLCEYNVRAGSHASLWTKFYVWLFADGRVFVRVVGSQGYVTQYAAGLTQLDYIPTVTIGGAVVFNNGGVAYKHSPFARYDVTGWIGSDPQLTPRHDTGYLIATKLIPNYNKYNAPSVLETYCASISAYMPGVTLAHTKQMGGTGEHDDIGLLPKWEAGYFVLRGSKAAYDSVLAGVRALGTYGYFYSDPNTYDAIKITDYPTWTQYGPFGGGGGTYGSTTQTPYDEGSGPTSSLLYEMAHNPSGGYLAYILTADPYYIDIANYTSKASYLSQTHDGGQGLNRQLGSQIRVRAWGYRSISQVAAIYPDSQAAVFGDNSVWFGNLMSLMVARYGPTNSFLGIENPYANPYGKGSFDPNASSYAIPTWQYDFMHSALGSAVDIEPCDSSGMASVTAHAAYLSRSAIWRLGVPGDPTQWNFGNGAPYAPGIPTSLASNDTSQPTVEQFNPANPGAIYLNNTGVNNPNTNTLEGSSAGIPSGASGYWFQLMTSLAFAVDHNRTGAAAAYARVLGADNYSTTMAIADDDVSPNFSVRPRSAVTVPLLFTAVDSGAPVPTPGPSIIMDSVSFLANGIVMDTNRGLGILAGAIPTGFTQPHPLLNDVDVGDLVGTEYAYEVTTPPAGLSSFLINQDGSIVVTGPDGLHVGVQTTKKNGVWTTGVPLNVQIGAPASTVTSVTVAPSSGAITAGGTRAHTATVSGAGSPSQAVTWATNLGTVNSSGTVTAPAATGSLQTGTVTATSTQDATKSGAATFTVAAAASTVTSVTVSPSTATGSQTFTAAVTGNYSPSQAVTWSKTGAGSINATTGAFTAPAQTGSVQTITITATSNQDGTKSGTSTVTIAAVTPSLTARTVTLTLGDTAGACANLTGIKVSFHDEPSPELTTVARYQSASETADASGVLTFSFNSTLASGGIGLIALLMPDGRHYLQPQAVS